MASLYTCVNASDLSTVRKAAASYKKMSSSSVVKAMARVAGGQLLREMQLMVRGEQSLSGYHDVADAMTVFEDEDNVVVGVPPWDPVIDRAHEMHLSYQLTDVVTDLEHQSGVTRDRFYDGLAGSVST